MNVIVMLVVALAMTLATWSLGWWALVVVALALGAARQRPRRIALAAALSWAALLAYDALGGRLAVLGGLLGGIFTVPGIVLMAITIGFAAVAAWSAATVAAGLRRLLQRMD
jgi:hypothetical protein